MSNFIYNNFNEEPDGKEPIQFNFSEPNRGRSRTILVACAICMLVSIFFGVFGGYLFIMGAQENGTLLSSVDVTIQQGQTPSATTQFVSNQASVIESVKDTVVVVSTSSGTGSGVVAGRIKDGANSGYYVITNAHVIEGAYTSRAQSNVWVTHNNNTKSPYKASVVGVSVENDIAILRIYELAELPCVTFASNDYKLTVGEDVFAIGNSLGEYSGTVTKGSVSYSELRTVKVENTYMSLVQLDISVYPGNSGGGLFNQNGELIGIVNAKVADNSVGRIGFAIPHLQVLDVYVNCIKLGGK